MKCGISKCVQQNDNNFLWRCHGTCERRYHAACIGVQRNHEEFLRAFMMPLCQECQERFTPEFNLKELATSFQNIMESIGHTLTANHKLLNNFQNLCVTHDEALEHVDKMLTAITQSISNLTSSSKTSATEIKNKLSALLDTPPSDNHATVATAVVAAITPTIATTTTAAEHTINHLPQLISALKNDLAESHASLASNVKSHMEEMAKHLSNSAIQTPKADTCNKLAESPPVRYKENHPAKDHSSPGWRLLGNKWIWRQDWSKYDAKQQTRRMQEKAAVKAKLNRKRRKQQLTNTSNKHKKSTNNINGSEFKRSMQSLPLDKELLAAARIQSSGRPSRDHEHNNINGNEYIRTMNNDNNNNNNNNNRSDKQLLAAAKVQFAGPPPTIDHPIAALSVPKLVHFRKGETINPYRTEKHNNNNNNNNVTENTDPCTSVTGFNLDPMRPPIVRLTQQSTEGDGRFLKARLRDSKIMHIVRLYLAYMKDQQPTVCMEGMTPTSIRMLLASEGLPTSPEHLQQIFIEVHQEYGLSPNEALADLASYRSFLSGERTRHLQQIRESTNKFYYQTNFRK